MFHNRLFTWLLRIMTLTAVLGGAVGVYAHKNGLFSPGPLSAVQRNGQEMAGYASHAEFEQECAHCHGPIHCVIGDHCQECHQDVAQQRAEAVGLHGKLPGTGECQTCHKEHQGRQANITVFTLANIDHQQLTGFSLEGHRDNPDNIEFTCDSCHIDGRFAADAIDCTNCHSNADPAVMATHTDQFGQACLDCHDGHTQLASFDHNQVYPLEGVHADTPCESCHVGQIFGGTARDCATCHEEPELHAGMFGQDCIRCHQATAWTPALLTRHTFALDHGDTPAGDCQACHTHRYQEITCGGCHEPEDRTMQLAHLTAGVVQLAGHAPAGSTCQSCHPTGQTGIAGTPPDEPPQAGQPAAIGSSSAPAGNIPGQATPAPASGGSTQAQNGSSQGNNTAPAGSGSSGSGPAPGGNSPGGSGSSPGSGDK
jgi:uncharacterized membrane protein YgcG